MRAYLITTGIVFALLVGMHVAKVFAEGAQLMKSPFFILLTLIAAGLSVWAWWLLGRSLRSR